MFRVVLISAVLYLSYGAQITTEQGEGLWIAAIDDEYDCNEMTTRIKNLIHGARRRLSSSIVGTLEELSEGDLDCFVHFSSPSSDVVDAVAALDGVLSVSPDNEITFFEEWGRDRSDQDDLPLDNKMYKPSYTGVGQRLYVIDTGIYKEHNDFGDRASYGGNFIDSEPEGDNNGHGTHCASNAAGSKYGIAPGTEVIKGVKVLSGTGSGSSSGVIKGIQWAVKDAGSKTCVLSMSLGGGFDSSLNKAAADASKKHIVVVAAGNSNLDACSSSPASADGTVITVGSTKKDDFRSSFSNFGKCVDIFGPGSDIKAAYIGSPTETRVLSGTSMATPYIAGLALQYLEKHNGDLDSAYNDLFSNALFGKVKDAGTGSTNLLGRIDSYTGPPTPPTMKPTPPPTYPEPSLCKYNTKSKKYDTCVDFGPASFGTYPWMEVDSPIIAPLVVPSDEMMCEATKDDFSGKVVMVKRGTCLFFDKVKNCEKQGAAGVIIVNDEKGNEFFNPAYYGDETTELPSCMIGNSDGSKVLGDGDMVHWGIITEGDTDVVTNIPSMTPTNRPTKAPVVVFRCDRNDQPTCKKAKKCAWDGFICYIKPRYQK